MYSLILPFLSFISCFFFGRFIRIAGFCLLSTSAIFCSFLLVVLMVFETAISGSVCNIPISTWFCLELLTANWPFCFGAMTLFIFLFSNYFQRVGSKLNNLINDYTNQLPAGQMYFVKFESRKIELNFPKHQLFKISKIFYSIIMLINEACEKNEAASLVQRIEYVKTGVVLCIKSNKFCSCFKINRKLGKNKVKCYLNILENRENTFWTCFCQFNKINKKSFTPIQIPKNLWLFLDELESNQNV